MAAVSAPKKAARAAPVEALREQVEAFLNCCREPAILEPGEKPLPLAQDSFRLTAHTSWLLVEAWDEQRTLARRVVDLGARKRGRLTLKVERFGGKIGQVSLVDLGRPQAAPDILRSSREILREQLRRWLAWQFPAWAIAELSVGADLENTLSPAYARALLARGPSRLAAFAAPPGEAADAALTFALVWLEYLRQRHLPAPVTGLALFLPAGSETNTMLRLQHLKLECSLFVFDEDGRETKADLRDCGNLTSKLEPWREPEVDSCRAAWWAHQVGLREDVELVRVGAGACSLRVRGLEFARQVGDRLLAGVDRRRTAKTLAEVERLADEVAHFRSPEPPVPEHPWYLRNREAWLESVVRRNLRSLDASLMPEPVYGQVPALSGAERERMDLLAIDLSGRLCVIETKAGEDPNLPLQALDYWIRVAHHAAAGEFNACGYFPGIAVSARPPRLMLVAPAMEFHPTTEKVLSYFAPEVEVERIGLGVEWQWKPRAVLRAAGSRRPEWGE